MYKITKKKTHRKLSGLVLILAAFIPAACLQPANEVPNLEYVPQELKDISADFTVPAGSDMIIVSFEGGAFQTNVGVGDFVLRKINGDAVKVDTVARNIETLAVLLFNSSLSAGGYNLTIRANTFSKNPSRLAVKAVNGDGTWSAPTENTGFNRNPIYAMAYGAGKYLAGGGGGNLSYSRDGSAWTHIPPGTAVTQSKFSQTGAIRSIAYGNGTFYAVGTNAQVGYSSDGQNWKGYTESMFDSSLTINAVIYGGGKFLAAGEGGRMMYMTDDGGWTRVYDADSKFGLGDNIKALAWGRTAAGENRYVAGGYDAANKGKLCWSGDGISWTYCLTFPGKTVNGLAYGNDAFVAVSNDGKIYRSGDGGGTWEEKHALPGGTGLLSVVYGSGIFIAAGHNGAALVSDDGGITWTPMTVSFSTSDQISCAAYVGGRFILAGNPYPATEGGEPSGNSRLTAAYIKPDVISTPDPAEDVTSGTFTLAGGDNQVTVTLTGGAFKPMPVATDFDLTNAGFSGGTIIRDRDDSKKVVFKGISVTALGSGKIIIVKASALSAKAASASVTAQKMLAWTKAGSHPFGSSNIRGIAYGNNKYVAVGAGKIATSVDGTTWTESPSPSSDGWAVADNYVDFQGIVFGNGKFIAVGYWLPKENNGNNGWGVAATSTDGTTWIVKDKILTVNDDSAQIYAIAWTGTTFVAVGRWGRSAVSPDGNVWTTQQVDGFDSWGSDWQDVYAVAADGTGKVVAGGANGKLSYSSDYGVTWTWAANYFFGEDRAIKTILLTGNTFIAAGEGGNMKVISANLIPGTGGDDWQGVNSKFETTHIWSLAAGGGRIIAVGDNGKMSESTDGFGWTALGEGEGPGQSGFTIEEQIACIVYGNGKFIIGGNAYNDQGNAGKIAYSNQ